MIKRLITIVVILALVACKSETIKGANETANNEQKKEVLTQRTSNANYSSLFDNYICDMSIVDLAQVLQIPAPDIALDDNTKPDQCRFRLKGFGEGYENEGTRLFFKPSASTKNQNKKVITESLKENAEMPNGKMHAGRDILLADAGDCYIAVESRHGRVNILNENYQYLFMISFGSQASIIGRTKEQQTNLSKKATDLANYLVNKHKN